MQYVHPTRYVFFFFCALVPWHVSTMQPNAEIEEAVINITLQPTSDETDGIAVRPISCPICFNDAPRYLLSPCGDMRHPICEQCAAYIFVQHNGGTCCFCRKHVEPAAITQLFCTLLQKTGMAHNLPQVTHRTIPRLMNTIREILNVPEHNIAPQLTIDDLTFHALHEYGDHVIHGNNTHTTPILRPRRARPVPLSISTHTADNPMYHHDPDHHTPRSEREASRRKRGAHGPRKRQTYSWVSPSGYAPAF